MESCSIDLHENVKQLKRMLHDARCGQQDVQICAATKTIPADVVNNLLDDGISIIGENRVQEFIDKRLSLNPLFSMHLIGHLQTNKVKYIIPYINMVQSLDSVSLACEISERCKRINRVMPVLVQINIAQETQKHGVYKDELPLFIEKMRLYDGIRVKGFMAITPLTNDSEQTRPFFKEMKRIFDHYRDLGYPHMDIDILSMGMSGDFMVAVQEGSTMVRIGTALFGHRK